MSYKIGLGDFANRYDESTGKKYIYSLTMIDHSCYDIEFIITLRPEGKPEEEEAVLSLWSEEARKLSGYISEVWGESHGIPKNSL